MAGIGTIYWVFLVNNFWHHIWGYIRILFLVPLSLCGQKEIGMGKLFVRFGFRLDEGTYKDLLRLKMLMKKDYSFNKFLNVILAEYVNRNEGLLREHQVDTSDFE